MNVDNARLLFEAVRNNSQVEDNQLEDMEEAFKLIIRTAIIDNPTIKLFNSGKKFKYFTLCFNKIEVELGTYGEFDQNRNELTKFFFSVKGTFKNEDYFGRGSSSYRRNIDELEFDKLVDEIIRIDELNNLILDHKQEQKEHNKRLKEKQDKIDTFKNGLEGKMKVKLNLDNSYSININNLSEEKILNLIANLEDLK